jgi:hypothetical protein
MEVTLLSELHALKGLQCLYDQRKIRSEQLAVLSSGVSSRSSRTRKQEGMRGRSLKALEHLGVRRALLGRLEGLDLASQSCLAGSRRAEERDEADYDIDNIETQR